MQQSGKFYQLTEITAILTLKDITIIVVFK